MVELLTPFKYVNRVTRKLATELNLADETNNHILKKVETVFESGYVVAQTTDGVVDMTFGFTEDDYDLFDNTKSPRIGFAKAYNPVIAMSDVNQKNSTSVYNYETHDTKVGSVTTVNASETRIRIPKDMLWLPTDPEGGDFSYDDTRWDKTSGHHTLEAGKNIFAVTMMNSNSDVDNETLYKEIIKNAGKYTVWSLNTNKVLVGVIEDVDFVRKEVIIKLTPGVRVV